MAHPEYHRQRLAMWSRITLVLPFVAVLLSEYLVGTRTVRPDLFRGAVTLLGFFGAWALQAAAWHCLILDGVSASVE